MKELLFSKEQRGTKINFYTNQQGTLFTTVAQAGQEEQPFSIRGLSKTENLTEQDKKKLKEDIVKYDLQLRGSEIYVRELLFSRKKSDIEFSFYTNQVGTLFATVAQTGQKEQAASIKGLSKTKNLTEQDKEELKQIIPQYDLQFRGFDVIAKHEHDKGLLGGWNEDVHEQDTYQWIVELFSDFFHPNDAGIISKACNYVDTEFDPFGYQDWHFNVNDTPGGSDGDSRIIHVERCLRSAIDNFLENREKSLVILGYGLHALQDIFAHVDQFVTKVENNFCSKYTHAYLGNPADNKSAITSPDIPTAIEEDNIPGKDPINQRYSDTKTATFLYLSIFNIFREGYHSDLVEGHKKNETLIKYLQYRFKASNNKYLFSGFLKMITNLVSLVASESSPLIPPLKRCLYEAEKYRTQYQQYGKLPKVATSSKWINALVGVFFYNLGYSFCFPKIRHSPIEYELFKVAEENIKEQRKAMVMSCEPIGSKIDDSKNFEDLNDLYEKYWKSHKNSQNHESVENSGPKL